MELTTISQYRYATKAYDSNKKVPQSTLDELLSLLRFSPSSVNSQPWHFLVIGSQQAKSRLVSAVGDAYAFNQSKVRDASHTLVFCVKNSLTDADLDTLLEQEDVDGRFLKPDAKAGQAKGRGYYVNLHREAGDTAQWMEKQVYLALGQGLLGASALGLDATPIEGFDLQGVDRAFALQEQGLRSLVLMTIGYRSETDFNAQLPKSRLPAESIITRL